MTCGRSTADGRPGSRSRISPSTSGGIAKRASCCPLLNAHDVSVSNVPNVNRVSEGVMSLGLRVRPGLKRLPCVDGVRRLHKCGGLKWHTSSLSEGG